MLEVHNSCLVAQLMVLLEKSKVVLFGRPLLLQTSPIILSQMHVVVFPERIFHMSEEVCCIHLTYVTTLI